jgi:hypothetical protein
MKYLKYSFCVILILFAGVQYNDPDPIIWIASYLYSAILIFQNVRLKIQSTQLYLVSIVYFLWAINVFPPQWEGVTLDTMGMKTINIELGRESLGLATAGVFLVLSGLFQSKNEK